METGVQDGAAASLLGYPQVIHSISTSPLSDLMFFLDFASNLLIYSGFFVSERERHRLRGENPLFELIHRLSTAYTQTPNHCINPSHSQ